MFLLTQLIAGIITLILGIIALSESVNTALVILIMTFLGLIHSIEIPIRRQYFMIEIVGRIGLINAIAINSLLFKTVLTLGPMIK